MQSERLCTEILDLQFAAAVEFLQTKAVFEPRDERLFYGLYQQIKLGDCNKDYPENPDDIDGVRDLESWRFFQGVTKTRAKELYVNALIALVPDFDPSDYVKEDASPTASFLVAGKNPHDTLHQSYRKRQSAAAAAAHTNVLNDLPQTPPRKSKYKNKEKQRAILQQSKNREIFDKALNKELNKTERKSPRRKKRPKNELSKRLRPTDAVLSIKRLPGLPRPADSGTEDGRNKMLQRLSQQTGTNPRTNTDTLARTDLMERLTRFYREIGRPEKIKKGLGKHVDWALKHGEEKLNKKLKLKYSKDLNSFDRRIKITESIKHDPFLASLVRDLRKSPSSPKASSDRQTHSEERVFKSILTRYLLEYEPEDIDKYLYYLVKYAKEKGKDALNGKLREKFGETLDAYQNRAKEMDHAPQGGIVGLSEKDKHMLSLFFGKYDPRYLRGKDFQEIIDYANTQGCFVLNEQLRRKYHESLDEFTLSAQKLNDEISEFYRVIGDKNRELIAEIVHYGIINGRDDINWNLKKTYGVDLDTYRGRKKRTNSYEDNGSFGSFNSSNPMEF